MLFFVNEFIYLLLCANCIEFNVRWERERACARKGWLASIRLYTNEWMNAFFVLLCVQTHWFRMPGFVIVCLWWQLNLISRTIITYELCDKHTLFSFMGTSTRCGSFSFAVCKLPFCVFQPLDCSLFSFSFVEMFVLKSNYFVAIYITSWTLTESNTHTHTHKQTHTLSIAN